MLRPSHENSQRRFDLSRLIPLNISAHFITKHKEQNHNIMRLCLVLWLTTKEQQQQQQQKKQKQTNKKLSVRMPFFTWIREGQQREIKRQPGNRVHSYTRTSIRTSFCLFWQQQWPQQAAFHTRENRFEYQKPKPVRYALFGCVFWLRGPRD